MKNLTEAELKKKEFEKWLESQKISIPVEEDINFSGLIGTGINIQGIFHETDSMKIRLLASDLILKRPVIKITDFDKYRNTIGLLVSYAEYLDMLAMSSTDKHEKNTQKDALTFAYYLSRLNKIAVKELGFKNFDKAFTGLSNLLKIKPTTLKNMRDEFDPYFDNGRVGWVGRKISPSRKAILDQYSKTTDEELTRIVKAILASYQNTDENEKKRTKIKITSTRMKGN